MIVECELSGCIPGFLTSPIKLILTDFNLPKEISKNDVGWVPPKVE